MVEPEKDVGDEYAKGRVGHVLKGKWRLDSLLGVGGMGAVYAATHRNGRTAAIKMLHPALSGNGEVRKRFLREGYVANKIKHRGAVAILDDDVDDDGTVFLVMELLEGETLDQRRKQGGPLPCDQVLALTDELLSVLIVAHAEGIVHRDIKPENIFLTTSGELKVLDFGIARLRELKQISDMQTHSNFFMGTPAFMAPEQARARWNEVDARTDIWAVGATMFLVVTGRPVHVADTVNELFLSAMTKPADSIGTVMPTLPQGLVDVVDHALAFEKEKRWPDARAMQLAVRGARIPSVHAAASPQARLVEAAFGPAVAAAMPPKIYPDLAAAAMRHAEPEIAAAQRPLAEPAVAAMRMSEPEPAPIQKAEPVATPARRAERATPISPEKVYAEPAVDDDALTKLDRAAKARAAAPPQSDAEIGRFTTGRGVTKDSDRVMSSYTPVATRRRFSYAVAGVCVMAGIAGGAFVVRRSLQGSKSTEASVVWPTQSNAMAVLPPPPAPTLAEPPPAPPPAESAAAPALPSASAHAASRAVGIDPAALPSDAPAAPTTPPRGGAAKNIPPNPYTVAKPAPAAAPPAKKSAAPKKTAAAAPAAAAPVEINYDKRE